MTCTTCGKDLQPRECTCDDCKHTRLDCDCVSRAVVGGIIRPWRCASCIRRGCTANRQRCAGRVKKSA